MVGKEKQHKNELSFPGTYRCIFLLTPFHEILKLHVVYLQISKSLLSLYNSKG